MVSSLRIEDVKATLVGFPFSTNRLWNEAIELLPRTADKVAIYKMERTSARPPQIHAAFSAEKIDSLLKRFHRSDALASECGLNRSAVLVRDAEHLSERFLRRALEP